MSDMDISDWEETMNKSDSSINESKPYECYWRDRAKEGEAKLYESEATCAEMRELLESVPFNYRGPWDDCRVAVLTSEHGKGWLSPGKANDLESRLAASHQALCIASDKIKLLVEALEIIASKPDLSPYDPHEYCRTSPEIAAKALAAVKEDKP